MLYSQHTLAVYDMCQSTSTHRFLCQPTLSVLSRHTSLLVASRKSSSCVCHVQSLLQVSQEWTRAFHFIYSAYSQSAVKWSPRCTAFTKLSLLSAFYWPHLELFFCCVLIIFFNRPNVFLSVSKNVLLHTQITLISPMFKSFSYHCASVMVTSPHIVTEHVCK